MDFDNSYYNLKIQLLLQNDAHILYMCMSITCNTADHYNEYSKIPSQTIVIHLYLIVITQQHVLCSLLGGINVCIQTLFTML